MRMEYYCRRVGHNQFCEIEKTPKGWRIVAMGLPAESGDCDTRGEPCLPTILDHDSVNYPEELGGYMDYLWKQAEEQGLSDDEIEEHLNTLFEWISTTERSSPKGFFEAFK